MTLKEKKLWMFTFEFGPLKVGGLGEVPTNQVKYLQDDLKITVFIPAHGFVQEKNMHLLEEMDTTLEFYQELDLMLPNGNEDTPDLNREKVKVTIGIYKLKLKGIKADIMILSGKDEISKKIIDDPVIYSKEGLKSKMALFSNVIKHYTKHLLGNERELLPDIIHVHDYHPMPAYLALKQVLLEANVRVPSILTIHLLTGPRVTMEYLEKCGVKDTKIPILINGSIKKCYISKLLEMGKNKLEYMSAVVSDMVTSVSRAYLQENVIPKCGGSLLLGKTDFLHNGCDWYYEEIMNKVMESNKDGLTRFFGEEIGAPVSRARLKQYLMEYKIENLPPGEPVIDDPGLLEEIKKFDGTHPFLQDGRVKRYDGTGKLALITGRASKQKGIDVIFDAMFKVVEKHPDVFFLLLLIPTQGEIHLITDFLNRAIDKKI
ncbi:MAG: glycogen/starch synthase, partial [Candidatus Hodarchaeota archaeon]